MYSILMPPGGQTTDESQIVEWHRREGDKVERGDILFEIETDKATLEVQSYCSGYLRKILCREWEKAAAGAVVAYIGEREECLPGEEKTLTADVDTEERIEEEYQPIIKGESAKKCEEQQTESGTAEVYEKTKILASPRARYTAKENGLKISEIPSKTDIVKEADVLNYLNCPKSVQSEYETIPLSNMRKVIARRMCESMYTAPHYTVSMDIDMEECIRLRRQLNQYMEEDVKITFNDLIVKCAAKAIEKYPMINSVYGEHELKVYKNVNAGLAVGVENGLVVPVVRSVNLKPLGQIARENRENVIKAQTGRLTTEEMTGGTITISNLGMYGAKSFTAVINQPESCILAVGSINEIPVCINREIVIRNRMTVTASFDHRVIDGVLGASFLKEVKLLLENPALLLL